MRLESESPRAYRLGCNINFAEMISASGRESGTLPKRERMEEVNPLADPKNKSAAYDADGLILPALEPVNIDMESELMTFTLIVSSKMAPPAIGLCSLQPDMEIMMLNAQRGNVNRSILKKESFFTFITKYLS
jgi:hypothetical protein